MEIKVIVLKFFSILLYFNAIVEQCGPLKRWLFSCPNPSRA